MKRARALLLAATLAICLIPVAPASAAPAPVVQPVPAGAGHGHAVSGAEGIVDLVRLGYTESEYLLSGAAETYAQDGAWTSDGVWKTEVSSTGNPYTTRMIVQRPTDPARFNGTVVVEWLNVSFGVDIPVDLSQSYEYLAREGYAYVGLTAQQVGADKLTDLDPARYPGVSISDDALSYDILTQAATAVRAHPELVGGRAPEIVLASGHSQSATRLTTYANAVQPRSEAFDGFLVHGRAGGAAPIAGGLPPVNTRVRTDLPVPVFVLQAETDVILSASVRQDTEKVRTWEVAGTGHADQYGLDLYNAANARDKGINGGAPTYCDKPVNSMTFRYAQNAAYDHLHRWARTGSAPPTAPPIDMLFGLIIRRDADQNALGGIRLPDFEAPIATYSPHNTGGNVPGACLILGTTTPFAPPRLVQLYPDHATYVAEFTAAADKARDAGYLLPEDHAEAVARAQAAKVP
ncbi:alpha/beta hydrolase domain-containing protein [Amycolatopsis magusensis]|uniref:alpha/beta hydrolase domain-containing protein n=1 Tax=Amycolatopsis magusensis TaxID=882444 RepID=UPI0037A33B92